MRVLLDENVPQVLRKLITAHDVSTVAFQGRAALTNGALLAAAETAGFEVMVTADQNMPYQQNIANRKIAVVALPTNRLASLVPIIPGIIEAIETATPGAFTQVEIPDSGQ